MNRIDIEEWAYRIIRHAERGEPIEDDSVELKAHFPEVREIARQLCGHANTSQGATILWLFGVDEKKGVVDIEMRDMATWRAQLESEFEGGAPVAQHLTLEWNGKAFVALVFRTDAPPYVVRNPKRNESGGGPFELEVSWRDGRTRAARRAELILLLRPISRLPIVDPLFGEVRLLRDGMLQFNVRFYIASETLERIVISRGTASVDLGLLTIPLPTLNLNPDGPDPDVIATRSHLNINGAGRLSCNGSTMAFVSLDYSQTAVFELRLRVASAGRDVVGHAKLHRVPPDNERTYALWTLTQESGA